MHGRLQQEQQLSVEEHYSSKHVICQRDLRVFFLAYVLSDHSIILRKCTPG